ncbi:MAG: hypothetical protein ABSH32_02795 [Bryobacteraceae bacterium]|jgi:hypothetical protein
MVLLAERFDEAGGPTRLLIAQWAIESKWSEEPVDGGSSLAELLSSFPIIVARQHGHLMQTQALKLLRQAMGDAAFRDGQWQAIATSVQRGARLLVVEDGVGQEL